MNLIFMFSWTINPTANINFHVCWWKYDWVLTQFLFLFCILEIKTTVIYPATERHIAKYTKQEISLVEETWEDYCSITLPYLEEQTFKIQVPVNHFWDLCWKFTFLFNFHHISWVFCVLVEIQFLDFCLFLFCVTPNFQRVLFGITWVLSDAACHRMKKSWHSFP